MPCTTPQTACPADTTAAKPTRPGAPGTSTDSSSSSPVAGNPGDDRDEVLPDRARGPGAPQVPARTGPPPRADAGTTDPRIPELLSMAAVAGYGYPDHVIVWRERIPREFVEAVATWAGAQGHALVQVRRPGDDELRAYWLMPRSALG